MAVDWDPATADGFVFPPVAAAGVLALACGEPSGVVKGVNLIVR